MCLLQDRGRKTRPLDSLMASLNNLSERGRMTWVAQEQGWTGRPEEVLDALATDGFHKCQRDLPASPNGQRPADGTWEGVNPHTKSVASVAWQPKLGSELATVFIEIDGDTITSPARNPGNH